MPNRPRGQKTPRPAPGARAAKPLRAARRPIMNSHPEHVKIGVIGELLEPGAKTLCAKQKQVARRGQDARSTFPAPLTSFMAPTRREGDRVQPEGLGFPFISKRDATYSR